ncbi:MAG: hypothetical protein ACE5GS_16635 [Kiloniellaceae bacterium]
MLLCLLPPQPEREATAQPHQARRPAFAPAAHPIPPLPQRVALDERKVAFLETLTGEYDGRAP